MFAFSSLLVECGYFDEVYLSFLVVGHTHCSIDQNFSVIAKKIFRSRYILSPLAMRELMNQSNAILRTRAKLEREAVLKGQNKSKVDNYCDANIFLNCCDDHIIVEVVPDYKSLFKPFLPKGIKFHQVPHRYKISRFCTKARCQYMLFSPAAGRTGRVLDSGSA